MRALLILLVMTGCAWFQPDPVLPQCPGMATLPRPVLSDVEAERLVTGEVLLSATDWETVQVNLARLQLTVEGYERLVAEFNKGLKK